MSKPSWLHQSGKDREEALENNKEAIKACIAALEGDNLEIPKDHFDAMLVAYSGERDQVAPEYAGVATGHFLQHWQESGGRFPQF